MKYIFPIAVTVGSLMVFLILSHRLEVRENRWFKILVSLPLVLIISSGMSSGLGLVSGIGLILSIAFLGFIWCGNIAWFCSGSLVGFLFRDIRSGTGMRPDFRFAQNHRRDGEMQEAI